jgi:Tfp pilus assembly protein PilF
MRRLAAALVGVALLGAASLHADAPRPDAPPSGLEEAFAHWRTGYVLHLRGAYREAAEAFRHSIAAAPTAEGHTFLGWSLSRLGRLEEAIEECRRAIALDPDYGNPYNDIGVYLIDLGRLAEAVPWLEQALSAPRYCCRHYPHFNLGRILLAQGDLEGAARRFERALVEEPGYEPALRGLALIREAGETL